MRSRHNTPPVRFIGVVSLLATLVLGAVEQAAAATIVVTSLADTRADDGACTLREAIGNANADSQGSSTDCAAGSGTDLITFRATGTITLGATLEIGTDVTIDGGGAITINGNGAVRVLRVNIGALSLRRVAIVNGSGDSEGGGGILNSGALTLNGTTVSGNSSVGRGGGIVNLGTLTVINSMVSSNSTLWDNRSNFVGGILNFFGSSVTVTNSIIASPPDRGGNCSNPAVITDGGNNIDSGTSCGFGASSRSSTDPLLDPAALKDNGGPTRTIALCTGPGTPAGCTGRSPAIDAGNPAVCAAAPINNVDQRRMRRPVDGDRNGIPVCDIGAFEAVPILAATNVAAKVEVERAPLAFDDVLEAEVTFTLGAGHNGIAPRAEGMTYHVGALTFTIPAEAFRVDSNGVFKFEGTLRGVPIEARITPLGAARYEAKLEAAGLDLTTIASPTAVTVTIGDDQARATVPVEFQ